MSPSSRRAPGVQQMVPSLSPRDAVGNHTLQTQRELSEAGYRGFIWVESAHPDLRMVARNVAEFEHSSSGRRQTDIILYQASTGSKEMVPLILSRPEPKLIYYHNITPPEILAPYDEEIAGTLEHGREELKRLTDGLEVALAASEFNARELRGLGVRDVRVVPPFLSHGAREEASRSLAARLQRSKRGTDLLFVGRVMPNKGHAHLIRAMGALRATVDPNARLFIVGSWGPRRYMNWLFSLKERVAPEGVVFTGSVSGAHLAAMYEAADVFVCLSEHEGFGIPLIEAMRHDLPVVAYDAGAVAETLDESGVLLRTLDPAVVAEVVARVASDEILRKSIIDRQHRRVKALEAVPRQAMLVGAIRDVLQR